MNSQLLYVSDVVCIFAPMALLPWGWIALIRSKQEHSPSAPYIAIVLTCVSVYTVVMWRRQQVLGPGYSTLRALIIDVLYVLTIGSIAVSATNERHPSRLPLLLTAIALTFSWVFVALANSTL